MIKFLIAFFLLASTAYAAPSISSISGDLTEGQTITINGSNFGTRADEDATSDYMMYKWDDFEDGNVDDVFTYTNDFVSGGGIAHSLSNTYLRHDRSTQSVRHDPNKGLSSGISVNNNETFAAYYTTGWIKRGDGMTFDNVPNTNAQHKIVRIGVDGSIAYPNVTWGKQEFSPNDRSHIASIEDEFPYNRYLGNGDIYDDNEWHRVEAYLKISSGAGQTDGYIEYRVDGITLASESTDTDDTQGGNNYDGWWSFDPHTIKAQVDGIYSDDVVFAKTRARVEIVYDTTDPLEDTWGNFDRGAEYQLLKTWSDTAITFELYRGSIPAGTNAYLFVIDENGNVSDADLGKSGSQGYPITLNGSAGGGDQSPPTIELTDPLNGATGVDLNANMSILFEDAGDGIVEGSINLTVEGNNETTDLTFSGTSASKTVYLANANLDANWTYSQVIDVDYSLNDGTNELSGSYSFTVEDDPLGGGDNVFADGLEGDLDNYTLLTSADWVVANGLAVINTSDYDPTTPDAELGQTAIYTTGSYSDFDYTIEVKTNENLDVETWADVCVIFGYEDANNYYYFMANRQFNESALYRINAGSRSALATYSSPLLLDNALHTVRIVHYSGQMKVYWDGNLIMEATHTPATGDLGFGSYNDAASFDNPAVSVPTSLPTEPKFSILRGQSIVILGDKNVVIVE